MRTNIYRCTLALTLALAVSAPAYAQSRVAGTVTDVNGQPVEGVSVALVRAQDGNSVDGILTNGDGEWAQIGILAGTYTVTVVKDGVGSNMDELTLAPNERVEINFVLVPEATVALTPEGETIDAQVSAQLGSAALAAGDNAVAILRFTEVVAQAPDCTECFYNMALAHTNLRQYDDAIVAFQRVIELDPMSVDGFNGLAGVYNSQRRFDLAAEASARATELAGAAGPGGANVDAIYNQGVIFWNSGQFAEAKTQFENTIAADPMYAEAYYQLGMASINLGQIPEALEAFQGYLEVAPDGPRAAEVTGFVTQLGGAVQ
jgi:tetratricopeptide (TPR) repeat protein